MDSFSVLGFTNKFVFFPSSFSSVCITQWVDFYLELENNIHFCFIVFLRFLLEPAWPTLFENKFSTLSIHGCALITLLFIFQKKKNEQNCKIGVMLLISWIRLGFSL